MSLHADRSCLNLALAQQSELLNKLAQPLLDYKAEDLSVVELKSQDLQRLRLPQEFVFAKIVRLPEDLRPPLELHREAVQLIGVISGSLVWAQEDMKSESAELKFEHLHKGDSILTQAGVFHAHATGKEAVIVLAVFTEIDPAKDQFREVDWSNV